jgi:hypothetical protein
MAVLGSAPIVLKIVGPTADYVGGGIKNLVERQVQNVERVFEKAADRLGEEGLERPGGVPPRVLKEVMEGAAFCEDELGAEYFGGILAASKSENQRDDRGATLAALAGRLSSYQLRCHYLMYAYAQKLLKGSGLNFGFGKERRSDGQFFIPYDIWMEGMELTEAEREVRGDLAGHCCAGLVREELIGDRFCWGQSDVLSQYFSRGFGKSGVGYELSVLGIELFTAAHGVQEPSLIAFVSPTCEFSADVAIPKGDGVVAVKDLPSSSST